MYYYYKYKLVLFTVLRFEKNNFDNLKILNDLLLIKTSSKVLADSC